MSANGYMRGKGAIEIVKMAVVMRDRGWDSCDCTR
jgi:hypothetical protein